MSAFAKVVYDDLYPDTDLVVRVSEGRPKYDLIIGEHGDASRVRIRCAGQSDLRVEPDGSLRLETSQGPIRQPRPTAWTMSATGSECQVPCDFVLIGSDEFYFRVPPPNAGEVTVIDPGLVWSSLLGGSSYESVEGAAVDSAGRVTIAGWTASLNFPTTPGAYSTVHSGSGQLPTDVFVTQFNEEGNALCFSTFVGGSGAEHARDVTVDNLGDVTFVGNTQSPNYPTTSNAYDQTNDQIMGSIDAMVTKLSGDGTQLFASTYIGGQGVDSEEALAVAIGSEGVVTITGKTIAPDFPTTPGAFDTTLVTAPGFPPDAFVSRLSGDLSTLLASTFLGEAGADTAFDVAVDPAGRVYVGGFTSGGSFPVTPGAYNTQPNKLFVSRLDGALTTLECSTFLGGSEDERLLTLDVGPDGAVTVGGWTQSQDFPTTPGAFDTTLNPFGSGGYITRFTPDLDALVWSTYFGEGGQSVVLRVVVDSGGAVSASGVTRYSAFPTTPGAFATSKPTTTSDFDLFVSRLKADGRTLIYSTYLGGSAADGGIGSGPMGLALDSEGDLAVVSETVSTDFPTTVGAFDGSFNGIRDTVVTLLDMLPTGAEKYGVSTPGCSGALAIGVTAMPQVGKPFGLTCTNAPASSVQGLLVLGLSALSQPASAKGAQSWVNPTPVLLLLPASSNALGLASLQGSLPNSPGLVGASFAVQFFWPNACGSAGSLCASNALVITVQS